MAAVGVQRPTFERAAQHRRGQRTPFVTRDYDWDEPTPDQGGLWARLQALDADIRSPELRRTCREMADRLFAAELDEAQGRMSAGGWHKSLDPIRRLRVAGELDAHFALLRQIVDADVNDAAALAMCGALLRGEMGLDAEKVRTGFAMRRSSTQFEVVDRLRAQGLRCGAWRRSRDAADVVVAVYIQRLRQLRASVRSVAQQLIKRERAAF